MPEKLEMFSCKFCGAEFQKETEALNCERSHLHMADMKLSHVDKPSNDKFCYEPRSIWPAFIRIGCTTRGIDGAVYQLVGTSRRVQPPKGQA